MPSFFECADTTDTEKHLLFQTVFAVASVKVVSYPAVFVPVAFKVGVEQVEVDTANSSLPNFSAEFTSGECNLDFHLFAVLVFNSGDGQHTEVLRNVFGNLVAVYRQSLAEISVAVEQANSAHIHIAVGCLFEVVACEDAEAARENFE